jgi:hypothetical protein
MPSLFRWPALPALLLCAIQPAIACNCIGGHSPCGEIVLGSAAFTGRVVSVSPAFLNRFNRSSRVDVSRVGQFYTQLTTGVPAQSLQALKETFRALVPALSPGSERLLKEATSRQALLQVFDSALNQGSYVTLQVNTVFAAGGDDDDDANKKATSVKPKNNDHGKNAKNTKAKDDDDDDKGGLAPGKLFTVWTPFGDCGIEFQTGETYLVYASMDEDSDKVETDVCMGTRRLSDAGADLPYLSFYKSDPKESGHLDGFVTSDSAARANPPDGDRIPSPVAGILIELKSDDATRYATSGRDGRFVFDGLAEDSYKLSGYATDYPDPQHIVAGPDELKLKPKTCSRHVMLVRPTG